MSRRVAFGTLSVAALVAWCGWASGFRHSTTPAFVTWSVSLAAVVIIDVVLGAGRRRRLSALRPISPDRQRSSAVTDSDRRGFRRVAPWLAIALIVLVWELLGIDTGPQQPHLTVSALAQAFRPFNALLLMTWMGVGLGYGLARSRAPERRPATATSPDSTGRTLSGMAVAGQHPVVGSALLLPASRPAGVVFWLGVLAACFALDAVARRSRGTVATAEETVWWLSGPPVVNLALAAAWAYAGWHLFAH